MKFFQHLESDIKAALKAQLRDLWTHTSTALEGSRLTLGGTKFVIEEGLTVSGKPLNDHHEVVGHARAIDLIYAFCFQNWKQSFNLVDRAHQRQAKRYQDKQIR